MTKSTPVLGVRALTKRFGGLEALSQVDFDVHAGEVVGLVGDNGAGKSTLVKLLSGVHQPTSGHIEVDGERRELTSPVDASDAGIATVYQDLSLAMQRNVAANFFLGRELVVDHWLGRRLGILDRREMERRTHESLAKLLTRVPDVRSSCRVLSGGQRQGLAIARAVTWCGRVLLLDELTSALGVEQQAEVLEIIRRTRDLGIAVVLVSHQMRDVVSVCDRVVVLRLGALAADLAKDELDVDVLVGYITGATPPRPTRRDDISGAGRSTPPVTTGARP
jgi:simple sugar transport system ATP-binding protein